MTQESMEKLYNDAITIYRHQFQAEKLAAAREMFASLGDYENSKTYIEKIDHFLNYREGTTVPFGSLNGQPILWKILKKQGREALLFCETTVGDVPWNKERDHANWSNCSLRRWLNKDFIDAAFSLKERMQILLVTCKNNGDPRWSVENGPDTRDKLFVFTNAELDELVPSLEDRNIGHWWWLRGHGSCLLTPQAVYDDGNVYKLGVNKNSEVVGVRPAMWIRLPM